MIYIYLHVRKQGSFWFVYVVDNFDWWVNGKTKTFRKQKSIKYWWTKADCHQSWKTFDLSISFLNFVVYLNFVFWALYVKIKRKGNHKKLSTFVFNSLPTCTFTWNFISYQQLAAAANNNNPLFKVFC